MIKETVNALFYAVYSLQLYVRDFGGFAILNTLILQYIIVFNKEIIVFLFYVRLLKNLYIVLCDWWNILLYIVNILVLLLRHQIK